MLPQLPLYVPLLFLLTTGLTGWLFYRAAHRANTVLWLLLFWLAVQAVLGLWGFYAETNQVPPRFPLLVGPPLLLLIGLLMTRRGRRFLDGLSPAGLTLLHTVRVPVELVLYGLYLGKAVPERMTFTGSNYDILSGLTAPVVYYLAFVTGRLSRRGLLLWNVAGLALLLNIVLTALLSAPSPLQKLAFDQPNVAVLYFPFVWLPSVVVPLVLLAHVAVLRQLITQKKTSKKPPQASRGVETR